MGELAPGETLDQYELLDVVARSGMATIYRATDRVTKQMVAVKVPFMQFESDPGFFARFQREEEVAELVVAHPPEAACRALVRRAREEGGEDNLSVQVAAIVSCPPAAARPWWRLGR